MATKTNTKTKNGYDYYRITRTIGHKMVDGKKVPIKKQFYGRSKTEAKDKYDKWKEDQIRKEYELKQDRIKESNRTLQDLADYFADEVLQHDSSFASGTRDNYIDTYKRHVQDSDISKLIISDIKTQDIQKFYNDLKVSKDVMKSINSFMSLYFKWLEANDYCRDIYRAVTIPEKEKVTLSDEIVTWTDEEIKLIEEKLSEHRLFLMIELSLYAGLRIGECFGLKYSDLRDENIRINRQYQRGVISPPKANSVRSVPMHDKISKALEYHKENFMYNDEYVFTTKSGHLYDYNNVRRAFERAYGKHKIPYKKFHAYRATFCTNLCKKGVRLEVASKLMGHKNVNITAKYYTFVGQDEFSDAISKL